MTTLLTILAMVAESALAGTSLDGSSGILDVPVIDTVPASQVQVSLAARSVLNPQAVEFLGLPFGMAMGLTDNIELGSSMEILDQSLTGIPRGSLNSWLRYSLLESGKNYPGLALQASVGGVSQDTNAEFLSIVGYSSRMIELTVALGPHWSESRGPGAWYGSGGSLQLRAHSQLLLEYAIEVDQQGIRQGFVQGGARTRLGLSTVSCWMGGGAYEGMPYFEAGLAFALYSKDPSDVDRDSDGIPDEEDQCLHEPEDLDGFEDHDGCPDEDNDLDGIPDAEDPTPNGEEPQRDGFQFTNPRMPLKIKSREIAVPSQPLPDENEVDPELAQPEQNDE